MGDVTLTGSCSQIQSLSFIVFFVLISLLSRLVQNMVPVLKYVRGEHLSQDHWLDMFRMLGLPRGTTLERLTFSDILGVADTIVERAKELKVCTNTCLRRQPLLKRRVQHDDLHGQHCGSGSVS